MLAVDCYSYICINHSTAGTPLYLNIYYIINYYKLSMNPHSAASVIQATDPEMPDLARILESGYQAPDSLGKHVSEYCLGMGLEPTL